MAVPGVGDGDGDGLGDGDGTEGAGLFDREGTVPVPTDEGDVGSTDKELFDTLATNTSYGAWNVHGGIEFYSMGDTPEAFNAGEQQKLVASVGIGFSY